MDSDSDHSDAPTARRWQPLEPIERRVLGVLIEKAKTTPEAYPLSLNAIRTGCNQKSNRAPFMQLEESQVEDALEQLRKAGAVSQVQGTGRVDRYRHLAYDWLGVGKVELAVMAELLLRGAQTVGELRGRAARMEPIKDLGEMQPTLDSLAEKGLIQYLSPPGRGCVITHALYLEREMDKVRREAGSEQSGGGVEAVEAAPSRSSAYASTQQRPAAAPTSTSASSDQIMSELASLRREIGNLKQELAAARADFETSASALRESLDDLIRQLGN